MAFITYTNDKPSVAQQVADYKKIDATDQSNEHKNDDGYSALQCAAFDGNLEVCLALLQEYANEGILLEKLNFINRQTKEMTQENILQVSMKYPQIFAAVCQTLKTYPGFFAEFIRHKDIDGDTVLHQIAEFARGVSLDILLRFAEDLPEVHEVLSDGLTVKNRHGETPLELANPTRPSKTLASLVERNIITDRSQLDAKSQMELIRNLAKITENFKNVLVARPAVVPGACP